MATMMRLFVSEELVDICFLWNNAPTALKSLLLDSNAAGNELLLYFIAGGEHERVAGLVVFGIRQAELETA